jgi:hypothetical protein
MSPAFTPFTTAAPGAAPNEAGAGTKAGTDPKAIRTFRPITGGAGPSSTVPCAAGEPKVTLERAGDRLTCIKIQCGCGHTIELACDY